jgi:hypothetical protein
MFKTGYGECNMAAPPQHTLQVYRLQPQNARKCITVPENLFGHYTEGKIC